MEDPQKGMEAWKHPGKPGYLVTCACLLCVCYSTKATAVQRGSHWRPETLMFKPNPQDDGMIFKGKATGGIEVVRVSVPT